MTGKETVLAMSDMARKRAAVYEEKLRTLDASAKTERHILAMSRQIAVQCAVFAELAGRNFALSERRVFGGAHHDFDAVKEAYAALSEDERESFLAFADAVMLVRHVLRDSREALLAKGSEAGAAALFDAKNILGVTGEILADWAQFWEKKGAVSCREIL